MSNEEKLAQVRRKTRQRLGYTMVILVLYFSFALNWVGLDDVLGATVGDTAVTGSLIMFASLIVIFIGLEVLFLYTTRKDDENARGDKR